MIFYVLFVLGVNVNRIIVNNDYIVLFLVCVGGYLVVVELFLVYGVDFIYRLKVCDLNVLDSIVN